MEESDNFNHNELRKRLQFEELLTDISARFINVPSEEIDTVIEDAMRCVCECLELDLSSLWQWSSGRQRIMTITHLFSPPEGPAMPEYIDAQESFPWVLEKILNGEMLMLSTERMAPEASIDQMSRRFFGVKSSVVIPLSVGSGPPIGLLSFDTLKEERTWSEEIVQRLTLVTQIFSNALARKRSEIKLREQFKEIEKLKTQLQDENLYLKKELGAGLSFNNIIGESKALKSVIFAAEQVSPTDATVLILGETGTGKGMVADIIHQMSTRKDQPFVTVDCSALPPGLIESELFGREKGAFTGAYERQTGRFDVADGGTIFLDEIGEMPLEIQTKLLRVLQEGKFERLGSAKTINVNVRVIAATNRDLKQEVEKKRFREDLYYRINVFPIMIPPLRKRIEDIPLLAEYFTKKYARKMGKNIVSIPKATIQMFKAYDWLGNVRELEYMIERGVIMSPGRSFRLLDRLKSSPLPDSKDEPLKDLATTEREHILKVLRETGWKIEGLYGAAAILRLNPSTLRFRMKKLGIHRPV